MQAAHPSRRARGRAPQDDAVVVDSTPKRKAGPGGRNRTRPSCRSRRTHSRRRHCLSRQPHTLQARPSCTWRSTAIHVARATASNVPVSPKAAASATRLRPSRPASQAVMTQRSPGRGRCLYPCRHPTQQDRRPVEAAALPVMRGSIARGTIERRPEKFGRDEAVLRRQGRIRCPARREHSRSIPGLTHERSGKNAQAISLRPCRTAHETCRQRMLVWLDRRQQLGCRCLVEAGLLQARKFYTCRSSGGDDRGAIAKLP